MGLADSMGATSYALGSGGFNLGFEMKTSMKDFVPGVSFAGTWEIGTSSTVVREFRSATSLASVGELGVRASIVDVDALGGSVSLEDGWKIRSETPLADVCRIGIETSLVGNGGLGAGTSIADVCRIGAAPEGGPRHLLLGTSLALTNLLRHRHGRS